MYILYCCFLLLVSIGLAYGAHHHDKRHIHGLARYKPAAERLPRPNRKSSDFFLRCPRVPRTPEKLRVNVAWIHNNSIVLSIINGNIGNPLNLDLTVKKWNTLDGQLNILANTSRWKFEYEEKKSWYALRIRKLRGSDGGLWKCRMVIWYADSRVARRYESRKSVSMVNRPELFTFKKRNLSDSAFDDPVTFTKMNADFTVFSRMSKFNGINYIRNQDTLVEDSPPDFVSHNDSLLHNSAANSATKATYLVLLLVLFLSIQYSILDVQSPDAIMIK